MAMPVPRLALRNERNMRTARGASKRCGNRLQWDASEHVPHRPEPAMPRLIADRPVLHMTSELGRIMAAARERELAGERVIHLERGEPDFDTPPHIVEALAKAARDGHTHYPDARGERSLREALVEKLAREN